MTTPPEQLLARACRAGAWSPLGEWRIAAPAGRYSATAVVAARGTHAHRRELKPVPGRRYSRGMQVTGQNFFRERGSPGSITPATIMTTTRETPGPAGRSEWHVTRRSSGASES